MDLFNVGNRVKINDTSHGDISVTVISIDDALDLGETAEFKKDCLDTHQMPGFVFIGQFPNNHFRFFFSQDFYSNKYRDWKLRC